MPETELYRLLSAHPSLHQQRVFKTMADYEEYMANKDLDSDDE